MPDLFDKKDSQKDKVTLGDEKFEKLPENDEIPEEGYTQNHKKEVMEVDYVEEGKPGREPKKFQKIKVFSLLFIIGALLALAAGTIQEMVFKSKESLIFVPKGGVLSPAIGVVAIALGLVLAIIAFISLFNRRGKMQVGQKWIAIMVGIILIVLGFSSFFRFVDYKENTIVDRNLLVTRAYTYLDITEVHATTSPSGENQELHYNFKLQDGKSYDITVNERNMSNVKIIDSKINKTAKRSIDNYAIQEMERLKMYTKQEALELFILE